MQSKSTAPTKGKYKVAESFAALTSSSATTSLKINSVHADQISVSYNTMPGNQPNSNGNYIAIWQNTNSIPWTTTPLQTQKIDTNTQAGSTVFTDLNVSVNSYIVGYAVGPELTGEGMQKNGNVCSSDFIAAIGSGSAADPVEFNPSLMVNNIGSNSVDLNFNLPVGCTPQANGAWVGIWRTSVVPFKAPAPEASQRITINSASGGAFINGITMGRGVTYTVGLFTSGWGGEGKPSKQTALACSVTFTV